MIKDPNMRPNGDGQRERELGSASRASGRAPLADREVPIAAPSAFEAMHRWLDGELSESELARDAESARHVELWRALGAETSRRGAQRAPADLASRIMSALPGAATAAQPQRVVEAPVSATAPVAAAPATARATTARVAAPVATSWWQRPLELNPTTAIAVAAGLVTLGLVLGAALRGQ